VTLSAAAQGGEDVVIERALRPLERLNAVHPDDTVDAAVADVARAARAASDADQRVIRARAIDLLALARSEWTLAQRAERVDAHLSRAGAQPDEWPDPIPLNTHMALPPFPLTAFPGWLREWVTAESHATQTPPDMAAMLSLGIIATACQRVLIVRVRDGWVEQPSIYTAISLPPGSRKSAVMHAAREPLDEYELEQAEILAPQIARSQDARAAAEKRLARAIERASKADGPERLAADQDMHDARASLSAAESAVVSAPQLSCSDATQEALARLLAHNRECMALLDAEGCGPLANMAGRYTDGSAAIDLYLRAHAGDAYRCDRMSRETISLRRPALTMAITTQPEVLRQLGQRREMRGLGLLARFLWVVPTSTVGRRLSRPEPMAERVRSAYASHVRALLELERRQDGEPHIVQLSIAADDVLTAWSERLEPRLGTGGDLEHVADWAGKLAGACVRIAGLLQAVQYPDCPWRVELSADTMQRALIVGDYLLAHAVAALGEMGADPVLADARHVLGWLLARNVRTISRRNLWHSMRGRYPRAEMIEPALAVLLERGFIRIHAPPTPNGPGRRPSPTIELSPLARSHGQHDQNDHNDQNGATAGGLGHSGQCGHGGDGAEVAL
jgi:hypothetical protein